MTERPKKPFALIANPKQDLENIRDKDNAQPHTKPSWAQKPRLNLAPPGMAGIRRGIPSPASQKPDKKLPRTEDLKRTFASLVSQKDKDRGIDR